MKKYSLTIALLLVLSPLHLLSPVRSNAGEPLSLKALIEEAKENNPALKALREKMKAAEAKTGVEGRLDDPTLGIEMMDLDKNRPLNISPGDSMLTRYTLSQMFPFPGKLPLKEKMAVKEVGMAEAELRAKELEVISMVKEAYFDYASLVESLRIMEEIKDVLSQTSAAAGARYQTGHAPQHDVIRVQVEASMLINEIITLNMEKDISAARLKEVLGSPQDAPLTEPKGLDKETIAFRTDELINKAVEKNPEIRMLAYEAEREELGVLLAKKDYYPDFMVGVAPVERDGRFDAFDIMFQMNIPIWRDKYRSRTKGAEADAGITRWRLKSAKNLKGFEVKEAALKVDSEARTITLFETGLIPQTELAFESALKNYQSGNIDFLTLLDAERELKKTRLEYIGTIAEYRKRVAALEKAVGEDF
ncbi:MAG: TolC family protein [Deltaproteobacteria bacterium]|nr:TolC family protein [Deltaproteobacteria bacterium]